MRRIIPDQNNIKSGSHNPRSTPMSWAQVATSHDCTFCATDYKDMIDWLKTAVAEPPILAAVSEQDIEMLVADVKFQSSTSKNTLVIHNLCRGMSNWLPKHH